MTPIQARPTRREFLLGSLALVGAGFGQPAERFLGTIPLSRPNAVALGQLLGAGLDGRLFTDLSTLSSDSMTTSNERFYVRTACPEEIRGTDAWTITLGGLVRQPQRLDLAFLRSRTEPRGSCLLECSGNSNPDNFGLMSSAAWAGVPMPAVFERIQRLPEATRVLVSGVDDSTSRSGTSVPGASWIFELDDLADAFLATGMNGEPLPRDHGAPVRLIVPGWYGCTCIKWVNQIDLVGENAALTPHMIEFAARTHQRQAAALARDFAPATIDHAAVPVRIEKWRIDDRIAYRVVGIVWGGAKPVNSLEIRFRSDQPFGPVEDCPLPSTTTTWSLWSHRWTPERPGRYDITLRISDRSVRARRLDAGFYRRFVEISEI